MSDDHQHPYFMTWSKQGSSKPMEIVAGKGARFTTSDGGEWVDMGALSFQANIGHGHPKMIQAIKDQADRLCLTLPNATFPEKEELARRLIALAPPGFTKVFFTLGGAEATENALKMARMATGRSKFVSRYRSYHGASLGALSVSGDYRRPPAGPGLLDVKFALRTSDIEAILDLEGPETVAAVILETIPGANGVMLPKREELQQVRKATLDRGVPLIFDEVLTGFGRTGKMFAYEHYDVAPDMITLAKGITGGYGTLGAVLVHERIAKAFDNQVLYAGLTAYAHPIACATAVAALKVYEEERLVENAAKLEHELLARMARVCTAFGEHVTDVRGIGLLAAMELEATDVEWSKLSQALSDRRVLTHVRKQSHALILSPPLCATVQDLDDGMARIEDALRQVFS